MNTDIESDPSSVEWMSQVVILSAHWKIYERSEISCERSEIMGERSEIIYEHSYIPHKHS